MRATSYLGDDVLPRAKKARATLGYLCLVFGTAVPRTRLASMLWDRVSHEQARVSFRQALSDLTSAMGPLATELISSGRATVRFNTSACWIDALALLESSYTDATRTDLAVLCAGELLEGLDDVSASFRQWLARQRIRFKEKLGGSLDAVLREIDRPGFDAKQLAAIARRLISFDPTHQGASRALMRALAKLGERAEALREYERCRDALMQILHVELSPESKRVYEAIRARSGTKGVIGAPAVATHLRRIEADTHIPLPGRNRLRVGVLPFEGNGSARGKDLTFSLSHEIATALARFRWFDVITPVPRMDKPLVTLASEDDLLLRRQLDYAVDGVVIRNGRYIEISVRLLDLTRCTQPVWSDRFELAANELHRLNEMVTARIVARIDPVILFIEGQPKRRERYGATGMLLLAIPLIYSMERTKFEQAGQLIHRALEIEPENAMALAWAAFWRFTLVGQGWAQDVEETLAAAESLCLKAIQIDPDNAEAHGIYGHTCAWKKEFDAAIQHFDRSLRLNPSLAFIWAYSSLTYCYIGEPAEALRRLERYRDLAPCDPYLRFFETAYVIAYAFKGAYEQAVLVGRRAVKANPDFSAAYKPLIASLGHLGRRDEAKPYIAKLLSLEPNFTIERFGQTYPFKRQSDRERYCKGLRLAGIPKR
jgi:DNA-binding SARP family transcriptional activator/TolB-like protein/Flp pilus assembly protein TadD